MFYSSVWNGSGSTRRHWCQRCRKPRHLRVGNSIFTAGCKHYQSILCVCHRLFMVTRRRWWGLRAHVINFKWVGPFSPGYSVLQCHCHCHRRIHSGCVCVWAFANGNSFDVTFAVCSFRIAFVGIQFHFCVIYFTVVTRMMSARIRFN